MMNKLVLKEIFEIESKHGAFYTGGNIQWSKDGTHMFCANGATISVLSVNKGIVISVLGETDEDLGEDTLNCFTLDDEDQYIISQHKSGLFKLWNWKDTKLIKVWKSIHNGPVSRVALSQDGEIMASGGSDSSVRLWNLKYHSCTHNLTGLQGVVSVLAFQKFLLFAAGDDTKIHGWDINSGRELITLSGHFSKVTSLSFHSNGINLISSGRDRVLILWDLLTGTSIRILPVYETIEGTFILPDDVSLSIVPHSQDENDIFVAAAGEKGIVKIWEMRRGKEIYVQDNSLVPVAKEEGGLSIVELIYNSTNNDFAVTTTDHNIIIHSLDTFRCKKQLIGYSDEILDLAYLGENSSHLAVATNSCDIKLYDLSDMNCQLLRGHTDIVLSLGTSPADKQLLLSSSKDNSVRLWSMDITNHTVICLAHSVRHTSSVGCVALPQTTTNFFISASQDCCLKLWAYDLDKNITVNHTIKGHEKDINSVTIAPNDKIIATGSQDRTAKLWSADKLELLGVLKGHKRGIWCVRFSPIDQVVITSSADCTIKLWSLSEFTCLKTLEGHESSVLRVEFLSRGMQIISAGADGLLKLWMIKTSECLHTFDEHASRVWTLAVSQDEKHIVSGGSDSLLAIWRDVTQEKKAQVLAEKERLILEEQELSNLMKANDLTRALKLALKLDRPFQVLKIVEGILKRDEKLFTNTIDELEPIFKESLLQCALAWNTNSKNCQPAQMVMNALITDIGNENLKISNTSTNLESMIPYTERHFHRMTQLLQDLHFISYTVNCMKPHVTNMSTD